MRHVRDRTSYTQREGREGEGLEMCSPKEEKENSKLNRDWEPGPKQTNLVVGVCHDMRPYKKKNANVVTKKTGK